jgi:hypothetical protein
MPKALSLISLVIAVIIVVLFLTDAAMGMLGMQTSAPLRGASLLMDLVFILAGAALIFMSWSTWRELRFDPSQLDLALSISAANVSTDAKIPRPNPGLDDPLGSHPVDRPCQDPSCLISLCHPIDLDQPFRSED